MATSIITTGDSDSGFDWIIKKLWGGSGSISTTSETYPNKWEIGIDDTTPDSKLRINLLDNKTFKSSSLHPTILDILFGFPMNPSSSALIDK